MSSPTTASAWIYYNTVNTGTTLATITPTWTQLYQDNTGTIGTYYGESRRLSAAEMISQLERDGHVVLKKQHHSIPVPIRWKPEELHSIEAKIHYGYAIPEKEGDYLMPDGSILKVDQYGNYQVLDQDAKVTYKANRIREFNPAINASDLLEKFIGEVGCLDGVNQGEILKLPIETFINWLILYAAKKDGDSLEGLPSVEAALPRPLPPLPRCRGCGRFLSRMWAAARVEFCSQDHWKKYQRRLADVRDRAPLLRGPQGDQRLCLP